MVVLTLCKFGDSLDVALPPEVLRALNVAEGDGLIVTKLPDGVKLTACEPEFECQIRAGEEVMKRFRNALEQLAK